MKLTSTIISLVALFSFASAINLSVGYNDEFNYRDNPLSMVVCADVLSKMKFTTTFGSLPKFPLIGASQAVKGPNHEACGSCWEIIFDPALPIYVLAIDQATGGDAFQLSLQAMDSLTNGHAVQYNTVNASSITQVDRSHCGLPA
jgi:hypothetical protein